MLSLFSCSLIVNNTWAVDYFLYSHSSFYVPTLLFAFTVIYACFFSLSLQVHQQNSQNVSLFELVALKSMFIFFFRAQIAFYRVVGLFYSTFNFNWLALFFSFHWILLEFSVIFRHSTNKSFRIHRRVAFNHTTIRIG